MLNLYFASTHPIHGDADIVVHLFRPGVGVAAPLVHHFVCKRNITSLRLIHIFYQHEICDMHLIVLKYNEGYKVLIKNHQR